MTYVCAILYTLGAFLYYIHQLTVVHFTESDSYSEQKALTNSIIWPLRVIEIVFMVFTTQEDDDSEK